MIYQSAHITQTQRETPTSCSVWIALDNTAHVPFRAGQFFGLALPDASAPSGWSNTNRLYSVSSAPREGTMELRFTVKAMGDISTQLCALEPGAPIGLRGPYGFFVLDQAAQTHIMLGAGIGVTPFRSMIVDALVDRDNWQLLYSCTARNEIIFENEIKAGAWGRHVSITLTREAAEGFRHGRIDAPWLKSVQEAHMETLTAWYICGSVAFVNSMKAMLIALGVPSASIHSEKFV